MKTVFAPLTVWRGNTEASNGLSSAFLRAFSTRDVKRGRKRKDNSESRTGKKESPNQAHADHIDRYQTRNEQTRVLT
jgi:hypothetical protein